MALGIGANRRAEETDCLQERMSAAQSGDSVDAGQRRRRPGSRRQLEPAKDESTEGTNGIVATIMAIGRVIVSQEEVS
jgi:hypothetical protein